MLDYQKHRISRPQTVLQPSLSQDFVSGSE